MRTRRCLSFRWQQPIKWFVLSSLFIQVICLKDLRITVPEAVAVGDTVTLSCFYDLENVAFEFHYRVGSYLRRGFYCGGTLITYQHVLVSPQCFSNYIHVCDIVGQAALYSVRWYFENEEFYRYVPKEQPPSRVFTISGVPVDIQRSSEHSVIIRSVSRNHSGSYQCEVSADAPLFHTESSTATMLVADLPESEPVISILGMAGPDHKRIVHSHETFKAHCDAGPSHPSVNFTWFVNGIRFPSTHSGLRDVDIQHNTNGLKESWSELVVQVDNHIVSASSRKLIIRCETNIYSLYRGVAESELYVIGDDFWLNGGKVSPTIDQRGNRGDPDNSALTGSALSIHRGIQSLRTSRKNIMKLIESLGLVLILLITVFQL